MMKILSFLIVAFINFLILGNTYFVGFANATEVSADMVSNGVYNTTSYYYNAFKDIKNPDV